MARRAATKKKATRKSGSKKRTAARRVAKKRSVTRAPKKKAAAKKTVRKKIAKKKITKKRPVRNSATKKRTSKKKTSKKSSTRKTTKKRAVAKKKVAPKKKISQRTAAARTTTRKKASSRKVAPKAPPKRTHEFLYHFGVRTHGNASMRETLGGKGANLAEMRSLGLPVPPGFTLSTHACQAFQDAGEQMPADLMVGIRKSIAQLERETKRSFGGKSSPLLVSVRSGAAVSMPGMMDTVLNLGLNDSSARALGSMTGNKRFAWDGYRRLIQMFGEVVMGVPHDVFEGAFDIIKERFDVKEDNDVPAHGMQVLCEMFLEVYERNAETPFPQDPLVQLEMAICAVFQSWMTPRAVRYRQINSITGLRGTAVNVQAMVFGNMGKNSGTGVAFTRNPSTGEREFFGEFLINAQGEDVVAGLRTPQPISTMREWNQEVYGQLEKVRNKLERHYFDLQDIEFTIEQGTLWMLQTRSGKRTAAAAVRIACDMVSEKLITKSEAIKRVDANALTQLLLPSFDPDAKDDADVLTTGLPASPGVAVGCPAFTAEEAVDRAHAGEKVLLVRKETSPEDIEGMHVAEGILTSTGGMTSHAAVVARGWGTCCVAGAGAIDIDTDARVFHVSGRTFGSKDVLSLDGATGQVIAGRVPMVDPVLPDSYATIMGWADEARTMRVRTNADTPDDATRAREFGAQGIGLCRTEHMFFEGDRIVQMRRMILAQDTAQREQALSILLPYQRDDFVGIFTAMDGLPVTIRLLDPPLHEFLPHEERALAQTAQEVGIEKEELRRRVKLLHEANPMLGHRGCRLAVTYPEILRMQVRAIVEATLECQSDGVDAQPEIMVPLVSTATELAHLRPMIEETIALVEQERGSACSQPIPIGTMIEIPRAALTADRIAKHADFFSFGTNDLTQMTYGFSRDDIGVFLPEYIEHELLPRDPFQSLDEHGVGRLVAMACKEGRKANPKLKIGICGEHGGDPASIALCQQYDLDYVSCSPFRVPIARLAAAQAALS